MSADAVQDMVLEAGDLYGLGRKHSARKVVTGAEALMLDQMWGIRHQMCFFWILLFCKHQFWKGNRSRRVYILLMCLDV